MDNQRAPTQRACHLGLLAGVAFLFLLTGCVRLDYDPKTQKIQYTSIMKDISGTFSVEVTKPDGTKIVGKIENMSSTEKLTDALAEANKLIPK